MATKAVVFIGIKNFFLFLITRFTSKE